MLNLWFWLWIMFMFMFLLAPIGYGWGYRGWGPPYPSYVQRRRALLAAEADHSASSRHYAWGWRGDWVWMALMICGFWAVMGLWWR